ncbi:hypothetical protein [Streptomyces mirabilis]|uniref:hypothetical protein n=1 Tax=Streptomyces mirabilis TaxID=68239 RepID=UPI00225A6146|nr:hypothetical protein [Streptomyces mirabilis]MCX4429606.1 hypothetical protein [Streptomyces mirabilis]
MFALMHFVKTPWKNGPMVDTAAEAVSAWAWGWDALVAIGTGILAVSTGGLALFTASLASRTRRLADEGAEDQRAQWRPLLLPVYPEMKNGDYSLRQGTKALYVGLQNAGRGPALHVRIEIEVVGTPERFIPLAIGPLGALAPNGEVELAFPITDLRSDAQILCDYRDVANREYSSSITINFSGEHPEYPRFYDVRCWEDHSVTSGADAGYPQPGLTNVSPKPKPKLAWLDPSWPDG